MKNNITLLLLLITGKKNKCKKKRLKEYAPIGRANLSSFIVDVGCYLKKSITK